nr:MAG TPA: hypothetical protein [Caudoviricetes sp.]
MFQIAVRYSEEVVRFSRDTFANLAVTSVLALTYLSSRPY